MWEKQGRTESSRTMERLAGSKKVICVLVLAALTTAPAFADVTVKQGDLEVSGDLDVASDLDVGYDLDVGDDIDAGDDVDSSYVGYYSRPYGFFDDAYVDDDLARLSLFG